MAAASGVVEDQAFVTLATTDTYALGAMVLAHSLRRVGTSRQLVVMISPGVSPQMRQQLSGAFDSVVNVDILDSRDTSNLALLTRPDLGVTFTKLHCWRLTQFTKCVFLDADTLVLQNVDELFDREELSAAPDAGWPDCFNSGVFVFRPSNETYNTLLEFAVTQGSFDGGDQGLLNLYFSDWATKDISKHLPFIYNVVSQAFYSYLPAFRHFGEKVKIAHFIGAVKPWHHTYNTATGQVEVSESTGHHAEYLKLWWEIFMDCVQEVLDPSMDLSFEMRSLVDIHNSPPPPPRIWQKKIVPHEQQPSFRPGPMSSPYHPPSVQIFYQPTPQPEHSPGPVHIENRDDRPYGFYESFYSEPPMVQLQDLPQANEVYTAKEFQQTWEEFRVSETDTLTGNSSCQNRQFDNESENSSNVKEEEESGLIDCDRCSSNNEARDTEGFHRQSETKQSHVSSSQSDTGKSDISESTEVKDKNTEETETHVNAVNVVGLAGELASLRLDSSSEARKKMNDRQRQFAWERGQIDYKGVDAFDNIMKQLDATISAGPKKEPSPPPAKEKTPPPPMKPAPPKSALKQPQKKEVSTFVMSVGK